MQRITISWRDGDGKLMGEYSDSLQGEPAARELYNALADLFHNALEASHFENVEPLGRC